MEMKLRLLFKGFFVLLMLTKDFDCYPFNGFYGCRDVFIWFQGEIVSCKYLMFPSRHGLHMNPKYYCTEYTAHRCCETCALLDRHNYRVIYGVHQDTTTDMPTTTDIYDYMRVNEIYKAPSIDLPANSDVIRYKVFNNVNEKTTTPTSVPSLIENRNYNVLNNVNTENTTVMPTKSDRSNNEVVNIVYKTTTSIPSTTTRKPDLYRFTKGKSTHITFFTIPNLPVKEQIFTTAKPHSIESYLNDKNSETKQNYVLKSKGNVLSNVTRTVQPYQYTGKTVEQFFTLPPHTSQTEKIRSKVETANNTHITKTTIQISDLTTMMETTTPPQVPFNSSTSFNSTFKTTQLTSLSQNTTLSTTTQKPTGQKKLIRDGCVDIGIWVVNGSVPCDYLVKDNKYGLNRNQLYFCNRYPLTSCCETCKRINHQIGEDVKSKENTTTDSKPMAKEMPKIDVKIKNIKNVVDKTTKAIMTTVLPSLVQDSTIPNLRRTTKKQKSGIPQPLQNTTEWEQRHKSDIKQGEAVSENILANPKHQIALPLHQNVERMIGRITTKNPTLQKDNLKALEKKGEFAFVTEKVTHIDHTKPTLPSVPLKTVSIYETSKQKQGTYLTTTSKTKASSKKRCVDIGIWFRSGSISCDYLIKDHVYKLNKNPLYFCNKYPLTSCCKTCALINLIISS